MLGVTCRQGVFFSLMHLIPHLECLRARVESVFIQISAGVKRLIAVRYLRHFSFSSVLLFAGGSVCNK
jgi:hypothetical protein